MDLAIASLSGNISKINTSSFDLKTLIELVGSIGTAAAAIFAFFAVRQSNKQLKIEQTPYVVLDHTKKLTNSRFGYAIKNIGKGPAVNITFGKNNEKTKRNEAFFSNDQPHSANLMSPEESHYWEVDSWVLENLVFDNDFSHLYIFFESQSRNLFLTKVKIKKIIKPGGVIDYVVMENKFQELKGEVGI